MKYKIDELIRDCKEALKMFEDGLLLNHIWRDLPRLLGKDRFALFKMYYSAPYEDGETFGDWDYSCEENFVEANYTPKPFEQRIEEIKREIEDLEARKANGETEIMCEGESDEQ